jgi:branched-subunit amino acid aminotransferase/4-amino-4-deoxychorismate lyase
MSEDLSWASPALRERIQADPAAVLKDRGLNVGNEIPLSVIHEFIRVTHWLWVEGKTVPIDQFYIDPMDEGLLFGRGVWESTRTANSEPWLWSLHIDRIKQSAKVLGIPCDESKLPTSDQVKNFVKSMTSQDLVIRLNISAGRPGKHGLIWMSAAAMQPHPGYIRLRIERNPVQKGQPYLLLKTFQYATRLRINQQVANKDFDSALMVDDENNILEAAHANIFFRFKDGWSTPVSDGGFLPGTVRHVLVDQKPLPIREEKINVSRLGGVVEAFCTNSNVGIIPVTQIDNYKLPVGPDTKQLMKWIEPPIARQGTVYVFKQRQDVQR